jgi:hypothetical protein
MDMDSVRSWLVEHKLRAVGMFSSQIHHHRHFLFLSVCGKRGSRNRKSGEALVIEKTVSSKLRRGFPVCCGRRFPFSEIISTQLSL